MLHQFEEIKLSSIVTN